VCAGSGPSDAQYIAAWRRVHDIFASEGLTNRDVAWVFSEGSHDDCSAGAPANTYPGSSYVDWLGVDGYSGCGGSPAARFGPEVSELRAEDPTKPVGVDEVGVSSFLGTAYKNQWINDYFAYLQSADLRMSLWFNTNKGTNPSCAVFEKPWAILDEVYPENPDGQLPSYGDETYTYHANGAIPITYRGFSAYRTNVQLSWVTGATGLTKNPRILTDAQFLGQ
jgi:hypothetical protein